MSQVLAVAGGLAGLLWLLFNKSNGGGKVVKQVKAGTPLKSSGAGQFSVVSYNVLADAYAGAPNKKMAYVSALLRSWKHRWPLLDKQLRGFGADIICLQEVDAERCVAATSCVMPPPPFPPACDCFVAGGCRR